MYLEHFKLKEMPFSLTPNTDYFMNLSSHTEAMEVIVYGIHSGETFIKIIGEVGTGKTLICRKVLNELDEGYETVFIQNPNYSEQGLYQAIAADLGIEHAYEVHSAELLDKIYQQVIMNKVTKHGTVIFIDEAQAMSKETLEALRLLSGLVTETENVLQIVLFAQPELDEKLKDPALRQLLQRISFSYELKCMTKEELVDYLKYRTRVAGREGHFLFTLAAVDLLFQASRGIPRLVNLLSHKAMMSAYGRDAQGVHRRDMFRAIMDTEDASQSAGEIWYRIIKRVLSFAPSY